jgi:hypothetical protein
MADEKEGPQLFIGSISKLSNYGRSHRWVPPELIESLTKKKKLEVSFTAFYFR